MATPLLIGRPRRRGPGHLPDDAMCVQLARGWDPCWLRVGVPPRAPCTRPKRRSTVGAQPLRSGLGHVGRGLLGPRSEPVAIASRPVEPGLGSSGLNGDDLLSLTPFGILVFDREGRLTAHNPASERLLGELSEDGALRCCELLGCRRPESALKGTCILELAQTADGPLPEIRVDLAPDHEPNAVWITVARLDRGR